jgi:hypothetical protein
MNIQNLLLTSMLTFYFTIKLLAQTATQYGPDGFVKIVEGSGGFFANLDTGDRFSRDHDKIGDVNGDGIIDLVVGARSDDDGGTDVGAVYILFMNNDGTVQSNQKISMLEGGFTDTLNAGNFFGYGVAGIGDYDSDGIPDIAVSAPVPPNRSIYIIHLNGNGTVKDFVKNKNITAQGLTAIDDLNGDGRIDIVACDPGADIGGTDRGAIRILFFNASSQMIYANTVVITSDSSGFGSGLADGDQFGGREVAMLGDMDGDGTKELAVGAFMSDGGKGAVWILSIDTASYHVISKLKITEGMNGFTDTLTTGVNPNGTEGANFGHAMCAAGDLNGDGVIDLITGANQQNEGWAYILYLNSNKTVKTYTRINNTDGGFGLTLDLQERFSRSISFIGDLRSDGTIAVNIGGGAGGTGTLYLLFLKPCEFIEAIGNNYWSAGNILFSNWDYANQILTGNSLTFEQCSFKAFETDAAYMTYNSFEGSCICKDSTSVLASSLDSSIAYTNQCHSGIILSLNGDVWSTNNFIHAYPNPTNSTITLSIANTGNSKTNNVKIYSILGELLLNKELIESNTGIDLSDFSDGIYYLNTKTNGVMAIITIIKTKSDKRGLK